MTAAHDRLERQLRKYNIAEEAYLAQLDDQDHRCPLCLKPFNSTRLPVVEHRHTDGLWRGLLCPPCNYELGCHHDNAGWFGRAQRYLELPPTLERGVEHYIPGSLGASRHDRV